MHKIASFGSLMTARADDALTRLRLYLSEMANLNLFFLLMFLAVLLLLVVVLQIRLSRAYHRIGAAQHDLAEARRDLEREKIWRRAAGEEQTAPLSEDA